MSTQIFNVFKLAISGKLRRALSPDLIVIDFEVSLLGAVEAELPLSLSAMSRMILYILTIVSTLITDLRLKRQYVRQLGLRKRLFQCAAPVSNGACHEAKFEVGIAIHKYAIKIPGESTKQ